uniref:Uncharacterized protein n=1 Tax=Lactuca sativa TaxID=4236 RepID=A0A9R1XHP7_LACSA|nr:hypothetical protein LSAT_V11C400159720 [Lactuca sativa]
MFQEKVACLADNDDKLFVDPNTKYIIQTKPHGHGDVHSLLYSSGFLEEWCVYIFLFDWFLFLLEHLSHYSLLSYLFRKEASLRWAVFFQDTNGQFLQHWELLQLKSIMLILFLFLAKPNLLDLMGLDGGDDNNVIVPVDQPAAG